MKLPVKYLLNIILTIVLMLITLSCQYFTLSSYKDWNEKNKNNEVDIYIGGYYQNVGTSPCYWKNGKIVILPIPSGGIAPSQVNSIFVYGNDIYCGGFYTEGTATTACLWKNGIYQKVNLDFKVSESSAVDSIYVSSDIIYLSGYEWDISGTGRPCYWINGIKHVLKTPSVNASTLEAKSIFVENNLGNNFYIAGYYNNGSNNIACYWINGGSCISLEPVGNDSSASSIFVSNGNIYISGQRNNSYGCYWVNGNPTTFANNTEALSLFVYDGDVYASGYNGTSASFWKKKIQTLLTSGSTSSIYIMNNDIYLAGDNSSNACYWKNSTNQILLPGQTPAKALSIFIKAR